MSELIRVAFIGAGYMASEHLNAFSACPQAKLVGLYSRSRSRAEQLAQKYADIEVTESIEDLYSRTKPDLVVIAVPELACYGVCRQAFQYPWTMLVEKPVGYNIVECREITELAQKLRAEVYVGLNRRFYGTTQQLKEELKTIDSKRVVTVLDQEDTKAAISSGQPKEVVKNWMFANSIHLIDYFTQFCRGRHISTKIISGMNNEMNSPVMAHLEFDSGDIGVYQCLWNSPGPWSVSVSTDLVRAELRPLEKLTLQTAGSRIAVLQPEDPLDKKFKPGLIRQAQAALEATKGLVTELADLNEASQSMELVESIYLTEAK